MRRISSTVAIITAETDVPVGVTVTSVTSVAMDPPLLLVCLNRKLRLNQMVRDTATFGVNFLTTQHGDVAQTFGQNDSDERFEVGAWDRTGNAPILRDALASLICQTVDHMEAGTHTIFVGRPVNVQVGEGAPLLYHAAGYGRFHPH
jgi:flavin reductase (DIM6/NTAB) family NADH-FMN oxidoreductase RutF